MALLANQPELRKRLQGQVVYTARGCSQCDMSGYSGRTAVFEITQLDAQLISYLDKSDISGFNQEIKRRMLGKDLFSNALKLVESGETTLHEALKILNE